MWPEKTNANLSTKSEVMHVHQPLFVTHVETLVDLFTIFFFSKTVVNCLLKTNSCLLLDFPLSENTWSPRYVSLQYQSCQFYVATKLSFKKCRLPLVYSRYFRITLNFGYGRSLRSKVLRPIFILDIKVDKSREG